MKHLHEKAARPVAAVVAVCGAISCVILFVNGRPQVENLDPATLLNTLVALVAVFGVLVPAVMALVPATTRPRWWVAAGFFLALTANAVTLSGVVAVFGQIQLSVVSVILSLAMTTVGVAALAEQRAGAPSRSAP
ncbi:hypothetical protein [Glycomyces tarimensis]